MSTTKRPGSRSTAKKPAAPDKPKRTPSRPAAKSRDGKAVAKAPARAEPKTEMKAEKKIETKIETKPETKTEPAKKASRSKKAAALATPPPPPRPIFTLDGPVPPEAAGLPKKIGALLGVGQQTLGIKSFRPGQAEAFEHLLAGED